MLWTVRGALDFAPLQCLVHRALMSHEHIWIDFPHYLFIAACTVRECDAEEWLLQLVGYTSLLHTDVLKQHFILDILQSVLFFGLLKRRPCS